MTITTGGGGVSAFLSAPAPQSPKLHFININKQLTTTAYPSKLQVLPLIQSKSHTLNTNTIALRSSSTSSASFVDEEENEDRNGRNDSLSDELLQSESETPAQEQDSTILPSVRDAESCKACGRGEIEAGCNGEGRIQGGIATVPGFGWWPIKAYRPCPAYSATGGRYKRIGQTMDEVTSGRIGKAVVDAATATATATATADDNKPKESEDQRRRSAYNRPSMEDLWWGVACLVAHQALFGTFFEKLSH